MFEEHTSTSYLPFVTTFMQDTELLSEKVLQKSREIS